MECCSFLRGMPTARESFTARLRHEVHSSSVEESDSRPSASQSNAPQEGFPCPRHLKPLLFFYKYLQPLPNGRRLQINLPLTLIAEKKDCKEGVLWLSTDASGGVIKDDKVATWRKRITSEVSGRSGESTDPDEVVAVRNVAHWRGGSNNKSLVLTRRALDHVVNAPTDLAFSIQQYVQCRGSNPSLFRVTWSERENRRFAINIVSEKRISDGEAVKGSKEDSRQQGAPLEIAMQQMARLSPFYCVTSTSDLKHLKLPRIRGSPIADGVQSAKRIVDHVTSHLPGIRIRELTADFIKDNQGTWWLIRVVDFDASYRVAIPQSIQDIGDSAVTIPDVMRSRYFRQSLHVVPVAPPENCMVTQCSLCGASCELSRPLQQELHEIVKVMPVQEVLKPLTEYRMTFKMVVTTLYQLRQRGVVLTIWESTMLLLGKTPSQTGEFIVCYLCYMVYKSQQHLARITTELHEVYGVPRRRALPCSVEGGDFLGHANPEDPAAIPHYQAFAPPEVLLSRIGAYRAEECALVDSEASRSDAIFTFSAIPGSDVDPTSLQLRFVFFFHELQDGGPHIQATDFYLEYQIGQNFTRLDFEGSKSHTPNRWQLCEARVHYFFTTMDAFSEYCTTKQITIKMKSVHDGTYHGLTVLSLRPLLSAAKWFGNALQRESRTDYLLELRTDQFGLLTLKLTLGLLVDPVPLGQTRELIKDLSFLRESPSPIFWPPPFFQSCCLMVPVDWVGALTLSEYVSLVPMRARRANHRQLSSSERDIQRLTKSASQRFSLRADHESNAEGDVQNPNDSFYQPSISIITHDARGVLASTTIGVKRIVYRLVGEVKIFPTVLLGTILRQACFLSSRDTSLAPWGQPATLALTFKHSIDTIFADLRSISAPAMAMMGEIVLTMLKCQLLPALLDLHHMEALLEPYWLLVKSEVFETISPQAPIPSERRMIWNRAIRRCEIAHFSASFRHHGERVPDDQLDQLPEHRTQLELLEELRERTSFRSKLQRRMFCEVFELMEMADSGYIDIAEMRSLYKCLQEFDFIEEGTPALLNPLGVRDHLTNDQVAAFADLLEQQQQVVNTHILRCIMESEAMLDALSAFDRLGSGDMNFDEFCTLAETAMNRRTAELQIPEGEPTKTAFCLRHGQAEMFALDLICVQCAFEYQDQTLFRMDARDHASSSEEDFDEEDEDKVDDSGSSQSSNEDTMDGFPRSRSESQIAASNDAMVADASLHSMLKKLEAAEWHIIHRRDSLHNEALEAVINSRRLSTTSARRSSVVSSKASRRPTRQTSFVQDILEFVTDAEERKQLANEKPLEQRPTDIHHSKKKRIRKSKRGHVNSKSMEEPRRMQESVSLSALLRFELKDRSEHKLQASRNTNSAAELIQQVNRAETKRKQLDRLMLAELQDVKQRLSKLSQSR